MDAFALNSATVNSVGSYASVVLLPTSTATVDLALYERIAVSMEGTIGFSFGLVGNIARVANLGDAETASSLALNGQMSIVILGPSGISASGWTGSGALLRIGTLTGETSLDWSPAGALAATKYLGNQTVTQALDAFGALQRTQRLSGQLVSGFTNNAVLSGGLISYLPAAQVTLSWETPGTLRMLGRLQGISTSTWINDAALSQGFRQALPAGITDQGFALEGQLRTNQRLSGEMVQAFTVSGALANVVTLGGEIHTSHTVQGSLANNAFGYDLKTVLMIRPESQREMIR